MKKTLFLLMFLFAISIATAAPVINMTFDEANWLEDSSNGDKWAAVGASEATGDACLWYDCANLSATSGDYLQVYPNVSFTNKFTISYWINLNSKPTGGDSQGFYEMGGSAKARDYTGITEGGYATDLWIALQNDVFEDNADTGATSAGAWHHRCLQYNGSRMKLYEDGGLAVNWYAPYGNLNYTSHSRTRIGMSMYSIDTHGYMDEFVVTNTSTFDCVAEYNTKKAGTPPDLDIGITNQTRAQSTNTTHIKLRFTIKNHGITSSTGNFNISVTKNGAVACRTRTILAAGATTTMWCNTTKPANGLWYGNITVDSIGEVSEDDEDNNFELIIIDANSHPRFQPPINLTYIQNAANTVPHGAEDWFDGQLSEDYSTSWTVGDSDEDVDPRAKKGYENALNCLLNSYTGTGCTYAKNHLRGWLNATRYTDSMWSSCSVQNCHDVEYVVLMYDIMWPNLTATEKNDYGARLSDLCTVLAQKSNVNPHLDDETIIYPANGWPALSSGMLSTCTGTLGDNPNNPSNTYRPDSELRSYNGAYENFRRINAHVASNGNDTGLPEGITYGFYIYHLLNNLYYEDKLGIFNTVDNYNNDICGRGVSLAQYLLDTTYVGSTLRGDASDTKTRWYTAGDSHSYDIIGEIETVGSSQLTVYGALCKNETARAVIRRVRDYLYTYGHSSWTSTYRAATYDLFYYKNLSTTIAASVATQTAYMGFQYDNAYDEAYWRSNYSYTNDTMIVIRGGTKDDWGHQQAQFSQDVYAMGEPFRDQVQVPYNDNTRSERWHNTMSYSDSTVDGYCESGDYTDVILNQVYCGSVYPLISLYPLFEHTLPQARGSHEAWGIAGRMIGASRMIQPYTGDDVDPERLQLIYNDTAIYLYKIDRTGSGRWQENVVNIYGEFTPTISGTNLTFNRVGTLKYFKMTVLNATTALNIIGGNSTVRYGFTKTGTPTGKGYYGHYKYYSNSSNKDVFVFTENWYYGSQKGTFKKITSGDDVGLNRSGVIMLLDTQADGITYGGFSTDAWGLMILNASHVALSNASYFNNGSAYISLPSTPYSGLLEASGEEAEPPCTPSWANTSWSAWTNSSCLPNNTRIYSRHLVTYDANTCPESSNTTVWDNGTVACTYNTPVACTLAAQKTTAGHSVVLNGSGFRDAGNSSCFFRYGAGYNVSVVDWLRGPLYVSRPSVVALQFNKGLPVVDADNLSLKVYDANSFSTVTDFRRDSSATDYLAYYSFEDGSAVDQSGNGNDGTVSGATAVSTGVVPGFEDAYSFDGTNDKITVPYSSGMNFSTNDFTISAFFKSATPDTSAHRGIFSIDQGLSAGMFAFYVSDNDYIRFLNGGGPSEDGTTDVYDTNWHHAVATRNSNTLTLYVDGVVQNTNTTFFTGKSYNSGAVREIGRRGVDSRTFNGTIDEVKIYNRSLSASEVKAEYNRKLGGSSLAVLNLPFTLNSSTTAKDYSTNALTGNVSGATWSNERGGKYGFDGVNDQINYSKVLNDVNNSFITVSLWIKTNDLTPLVPISKYQGSGVGWYIRIGLSSGGNCSTVYWLPKNFDRGVGKTMCDGNWHHILITQSSSTVNTYVDGVNKGIDTGAYTNIATNGYLLIGRETSNFFNGSIDDVVILPYAASTAEIAALYAAGLQNKSLETIQASRTSTGDYWSVNVTATNKTTSTARLSDIINIG
jgi:hypothetical protein